MYLKIITTALFYAIISTVIGLLISQFIFKDPGRKFDRKIIKNFFLTALLVHFIVEFLGISKRYCLSVHCK